MKLFVNLLTTSRIPLIVIFALFNLFYNTKNSPLFFFISIIIMALVGITDFLDGYLARKYNVTSKFGAHADPLTDKVFFLATLPLFIYLSSKHCSNFHTILMVLMASTYSIRDQIVTFFRTIGSLHNISAKATWYGKLRTAISFPSIIAIYYYMMYPSSKIDILFFNILQFPSVVIYSLEIFLILLTLITLFMYFFKYYPAIKKELDD